MVPQHPFDNEKGGSLIELLVTLSLLTVVIGLLGAFIKEGFIHYDRTVSQADLQVSLRHQSDKILKDIRSSKSGTIGETDYPFVEEGKLVLLIGNRINEETITYFLNGETVYRKRGDLPAEIVCRNVIDFSVTVENSLITIHMTVKPITKRYGEEIRKEIDLQAKPRTILPASP